MQAASYLEAQGKQVRIIDMYSIKPLDEQVVIKAAEETSGIITIEDHSIIGGLGGAVSEVIAEHTPQKPVIRLGLKDCFGRSGDKKGLLELYNLTPQAVIEAVGSLLVNQ